MNPYILLAIGLALLVILVLAFAVGTLFGLSGLAYPLVLIIALVIAGKILFPLIFKKGE